MSITLRPGDRLLSAVCTTELIAVKAPDCAVELTIGGVAPVGSAADRTATESIADGHGGGAVMGRRYVDSTETIELLCTKAGEGVPALGDELLQPEAAKALPASD